MFVLFYHFHLKFKNNFCFDTKNRQESKEQLLPVIFLKVIFLVQFLKKWLEILTRSSGRNFISRFGELY